MIPAASTTISGFVMAPPGVTSDRIRRRGRYIEQFAGLEGLVAGKTIRAEIDDATALALDGVARHDGRPRSQIVTTAVKTFIDLSPAARLALFAIDGLATEDERSLAMALIGQVAIDAYRGILAARQGADPVGEEPDTAALLSLLGADDCDD
jgi:predicted transcriptional regulator